MTEPTHEKALQEFIERAKDELGGSVRKLVLYGSVARGDYGQDSDIDVFAVVESREDLQLLRDLAFDVGVMEYGVSISVQGKTEKSFDGFNKTSFLRNVERDGIEYA